MKTCTACGEIKPFTEFGRHAGARDGHRRSCKYCTVHNPTQRQLYIRKYYEENAEAVKEKSREHREANHEEVMAKQALARLERIARDPEAEKIRSKNVHLKNKFGINLDQYNELLDRQNGCCAICDRHHSEFKIMLAVDHSHRSKRIRGLLCTACNYRLVARHEDPAILHKIADYISQSTEWIVPDKKRKKKRNTRGKRNSSNS